MSSFKVLQKVGFAIIGTKISYAKGRDAEIEETILRLGKPADIALFTSRRRTTYLVVACHRLVGLVAMAQGFMGSTSPVGGKRQLSPPERY